MSGKFTRTIELTTNIAIITVAVLLGIVLIKNYVLSGPGPNAPGPPSTIPTGTKLSVQDVDWAAMKRTMLMVLSNTCRFCTESARLLQVVLCGPIHSPGRASFFGSLYRSNL